MSSFLAPAQTDTLDMLRVEPDKRPIVRRELRKELQEVLELELRDIEGPISIDKTPLSQVHQCEGRYLAVDMFEWRPANARGTVAHKAIELSVGGTRRITPTELVNAAMDRICEGPETQSLAGYLRSIDDAERAELRVSATDVVVKFSEMFPPLKDAWIPNAEATTAAFAGFRRVVFRGKIDLKLGDVRGDRSNTIIIDLKTGNPSFTDLDDLRFYALLETLRTGVPPFKWANAYLSAGRIESEDFDEDRIWAALRRAVDGARKISELQQGRKPKLTPGAACRFCPARLDCTEAQVQTTD